MGTYTYIYNQLHFTYLVIYKRRKNYLSILLCFISIQISMFIYISYHIYFLHISNTILHSINFTHSSLQGTLQRNNIHDTALVKTFEKTRNKLVILLKIREQTSKDTSEKKMNFRIYFDL